MNFPFTSRSACTLCERRDLRPILQLPGFPLTEIYTNQSPTMHEEAGRIDQTLLFCESCSHGQLLNVVDQALLYCRADNNVYQTSQSLTGRASCDFFYDFIEHCLPVQQYRLAVEIGSNDLYLAKKLLARAQEVVAIDPNPILDDVTPGITVVTDYIEQAVLTGVGGEAELVILKDVFEHLPDPMVVLRKLLENAAPGANFFIQVPVLDVLLAESRFDQVFHQHLNYFSLHSFQWMLTKLGCSLINYTVNLDHWGSGIFHFQTCEKYRRVSFPMISPERFAESERVFRMVLDAARCRLEFMTETVYGYGASLMLPVLFYHIHFQPSRIKAILDDDRRKSGLYYINLPYRIFHPDEVRDIESSVLFLTAIQSRLNVRRMTASETARRAKYLVLPINNL